MNSDLRYGCSYKADGITVINLYGTWHRMGCQYGVHAGLQMRDVLAYLEKKLGPDTDRMVAARGIADKLYSNYPRHLKEFFNGVCLTSRLSLEDVKLCNAVEYVEGEFMCSAFAAWGEFGQGKQVVGRNYDAVNYSEIGKDIVVTVYHPWGKMPAATVGYAGELYCVNGFNTKGIYIELNNGMPSAGTEIHWELRQNTVRLFDALFNASTMDEFDSFFRNTRSSSSLIIGVADGFEARSYEWCYDGLRRGDEKTADGVMISTNHYVNDGWPYATPDDNSSWNSVTRRCNIEALALKYKGSIDADRMKEIMSTPIEEGGPSHSFTRYRIVAVPEDMTLHICIPDYCGWVRLKMDEFFCIFT